MRRIPHIPDRTSHIAKSISNLNKSRALATSERTSAGAIPFPTSPTTPSHEIQGEPNTPSLAATTISPTTVAEKAG